MKQFKPPSPKSLQTQQKIERVKRMKRRVSAWWTATHPRRFVVRRPSPAGVMRQAYDQLASVRAAHQETA